MPNLFRYSPHAKLTSMTRSNNRKIARRLAVKSLAIFAACFTLAFIIGSLTFIPGTSHAEVSDSTDVDINLEIEPVISLTLNKSIANFSVTPTPSGALTTTEVVATVGTNNSTGYILTMSSKTLDNFLAHTDSTTKVLSTTHTTANTLTTNTWGYNNITSATTFLAIPLPTSAATINSSIAPINNDNTTITFGAFIDVNQKAGIYEQTVTFTAVTNHVPPPQERFRFTIDTRMTDTIDTDPTHYSGTATVFSIPTNSCLGSNSNDWCYDYPEHPYDWLIDWGDGTPEQHAIGTSAIDSNGITHDYATTGGSGEYQITIKSNGPAYNGWMNAFGWNDSEYVGAGTMNNRLMLKSLDSSFTDLMRSKNATWRFAMMFVDARNATTIPPNLFRRVDTTGVTDLSGLFVETFFRFARNSTTGTIPAGLFNSIDTSSATDLSFMFYSTFNNFAQNSTTATIPSGLFSSIDTSSATDLSRMFSGTFYNFAQNSTTATIPSGLFSFIDTSSAINLSHMFSGTFNNFAQNSTTATIPAGLFSTIDTSSATNLAYMFDSTFASFAQNSTVTTDINDIWGSANFSGKVTSSNASSVFGQTFNSMPSLTGSAQTFITNKLNSVNPSSRAYTFQGTGVTDLGSLHTNWK